MRNVAARALVVAVSAVILSATAGAAERYWDATPNNSANTAALDGTGIWQSQHGGWVPGANSTVVGSPWTNLDVANFGYHTNNVGTPQTLPPFTVTLSAAASANGLRFANKAYTVDSTANGYLTVNGNVETLVDATIAGRLATGSAITKTGASALNFSSSQSYTGTTNVNGGSLFISGNIGELNLNQLGTISPGTGAGVQGELSVTNATLAGTYDVTATTAVSGGVGLSDKLIVSSTATVPAAGLLKINMQGSGLAFNPAPGEVYEWLIASVGTMNSVGSIQVVSANFGILSNFSVVQPSNGSSGNIVVRYYSAVPEATTMLLGFAGLTPVLLQRRGRKTA